MGQVALPMMIASTGMQIAGAAARAQAERAAGRSEQMYYDFVAEGNLADAQRVKESADRQVGNIEYGAALDRQVVKRRGQEVRGAQAASVSASGIGLDSATAEDIMRDTNNKQTLDETLIRINANESIYQTRMQSIDQSSALRREASMNRLTGSNARLAARTRARVGILNSATQVAGQWSAWKSQ